MALILSTVETAVRYMIGDTSITGTDIFTYTISNVFTLTESNVNTVVRTYLNNVEMGASELAYDSTTNKVTVYLTMSSGDTVEIEYTYYPNYSSTEIQNYIQAALTHISICNYKDWVVAANTIYPEPTTREKNLITAITSTIIKPDNVSYRLPDVSVTLPKDLPTVDKIRKLISIFKRDSHGFIKVLPF